MIETLVTLFIMGLIGSLFNKKGNNPTVYSQPDTLNYSNRAQIVKSLTEWEKIRLLALEKYGAICSSCGTNGDIENPLNVHHIVSPLVGGTNSLDNLQVLCHDCHGKIHGRELSTKFSVPSNYGVHSVSNTIRLLNKAINEGNSVVIEYINPENIKTCRIISPHSMYVRDSHKYVVGFCHLRNDKRTFRISRIHSIQEFTGKDLLV